MLSTIVCIVGYYKNGAECTQCDTGKTTDSIGNNEMSDCGKRMPSCLVDYQQLFNNNLTKHVSNI